MPIAMGVSCANTGGRADRHPAGLAPEPPVGGGGWVEDCYQPTVWWGRGGCTRPPPGLREAAARHPCLRLPRVGHLWCGESVELLAVSSARRLIFPRWCTIPPGTFAAWAYSAAREPPHGPITFSEEALVLTHHGMPGGIQGGRRDLPPRRRTSGHAGTVARRRHRVACYQASSLRLGQWILEGKTPR